MSKIKKADVSKSNVKIDKKSISTNVGLCFNFREFQKQSISITGFNNCFLDSDECLNFISKAIDKLKYIGGCTNFSELLFNENMHCHKIAQNQGMLDHVLRKYGYPREKIDEIFEGEIYQVKVAAGNPAGRMVFYLIDGHVIVPLFVDTNHHLYRDKKRGYDNNLGAKKYSLP